ncbi:MAG: hypoxanthine phosphoribosyltransferase [Phycisphaerae bacterium]|nr:hypoxanthine phosphoribosyltransferase [Phycisphaerae bacterium]
MEHKRILISTEKLKETIAYLASQINAAYATMENVMALVILEGAKYFAEDLLEQLSFPIEIDYLKASSYCGTASGCTVAMNVNDNLHERLKGKNILVIDDIYDTGRTLSTLLKWIKDSNPQSIKTCVLLEKEVPHDKNITIDFPGMKVPDVFVIGYGLDFDGQYRELPFIAELAPERIKE